MKNGVLNRDYIAYVYFEGDKCIYQEIKIDHPNEMELVDIEFAVRSSSTDYVDVQDLFYKLIPRDGARKEYRYCYPHDYYERYISEAEYPRPKTRSQLQGYYSRVRSSAREELLRRRRHKDCSSSADPRSDEELKDAENNTERYVKDRLYKGILRWVYARDYANTLTELLSIHPDCIYTHDGHGREHNYSRQLSEDIGFSMITNFSYGGSTKFFVNFSYKGINLLPYSTLVNYYYAGIEELIRYTRSYSHFRSNWSNALKEIVFISNSAVEDPTKFVNEWLSTELDGMMEALEDFMNNTHSRVASLISHPKADAGKFLTIENASYDDRSSFQVRPNRVELICKAEKITSALKFIDSIKAVADFYQPAQNYAHRILAFNGSLLEQVADELVEIENTISDLQEQIHNGRERIKEIVATCAKDLDHYNRLNNTKSFTYEKRQKFLVDFPLVKQALSQIAIIDSEYDTLSTKLSDQKSYRKLLSGYVLKVLNYWHKSYAPEGICEWPVTVDYKVLMTIYDNCPSEYKLPDYN